MPGLYYSDSQAANKPQPSGDFSPVWRVMVQHNVPVDCRLKIRELWAARETQLLQARAALKVVADEGACAGEGLRAAEAVLSAQCDEEVR